MKFSLLTFKLIEQNRLTLSCEPLNSYTWQNFSWLNSSVIFHLKIKCTIICLNKYISYKQFYCIYWIITCPNHNVKNNLAYKLINLFTDATRKYVKNYIDGKTILKASFMVRDAAFNSSCLCSVWLTLRSAFNLIFWVLALFLVFEKGHCNTK